VNEEWTISWVWWITAVEVPALGCLFWLTHHGRREAERALLRVYREIQSNLNMVLENLAQSKLDAARFYATVVDLKDVEKRLTDHLLRLEARLTYAFSAELPSEMRKPRRSAEQPYAAQDGSDPNEA
jgi:hypothetical protein